MIPIWRNLLWSQFSAGQGQRLGWDVPVITMKRVAMEPWACTPKLSDAIFYILCTDVFCFNMVSYSTVFHAACQVEYGVYFILTNDIPYLALTGEIRGVFCEYFGKNS